MEFEIIEVNGTLKKVSTQGGSTMPSATTKRPSVVENITVLQIGDFGVRVDEKNWYNTNEPLKPTAFVVNQSYKVSLSVAKSGKKYINEIIGVADAAPAASAPAETATASQATTDPVKAAEEALAKAKADAEAKVKAEAEKAAAAAAKATVQAGLASGDVPSRAGYDKPLTKYDLKKDAQIARSGIVQAALQSPGIAQWSTNLDEYLKNVEKVADFALAYVLK